MGIGGTGERVGQEQVLFSLFLSGSLSLLGSSVVAPAIGWFCKAAPMAGNVSGMMPSCLQACSLRYSCLILFETKQTWTVSSVFPFLSWPDRRRRSAP